jgi:Zn-finger nucleic acid-binding protein
VQLDVSEVHVEQCSRCLGCFARTADFSELLEREVAGDAVGLRRFVPLARGRELPRQTLLALVSCPHCNRQMDRVRFADRASLIVDVCAKHGIWLDAGELVAVLDFVKQRAEGKVAPDPVEVAEEANEERFDVLRSRARREVDAHVSRAEELSKGSNLAPVIAATAVGGPWLGLFVALRKKRSAKR